MSRHNCTYKGLYVGKIIRDDNTRLVIHECTCHSISAYFTHETFQAEKPYPLLVNGQSLPVMVSLACCATCPRYTKTEITAPHRKIQKTAAPVGVDLTISEGPGTELAGIFSELHIIVPDNCSCKKVMTQMNLWGPDGCRKNKPEIIKAIKENEGKWNLAEKLTSVALAAFFSIQSGLVFKIDPLNPLPGLVDESIARAEIKLKK